VADYYHYYWFYHLLLCLWTYTFTTSAAVMIIAGAMGHWYFRTDDMPVRGLPVLRSALRLVCFQLGTLAFGSLVVAVVWMLRLTIQWAAKKMKSLQALPLAGVVLCMMECCMRCLESFIRFINRSTLIVAAFSGKGYCRSAHKAGSLLMANVLRVAAVSTSSRLILFLGQLFVTAAATTAAWWWLVYDPLQLGHTHVKVWRGEARAPVASLTLVALLSWFLGRAIMGVYWVVIDSVMMCFFYDSERDNSLPVSDRIQGRWRSKKILADSDDEADNGRSDLTQEHAHKRAV